MSLHYGHQNPGIFLNDDLRIVQLAYASVLAEEWDTQGPCKADVGRYVLRMYDRGIVDPVKLTSLASLHFRARIPILTQRSLVV